MSAPGKIALRRITQTKNGATYEAFLVSGYEGGKRFRKQFKTEEEARGFMASKSVELLNDSQVNTVTTTLSAEQVSEAESAFRRLAGRGSLDDAVAAFLESYAPPEESVSLRRAHREYTDHCRESGKRERSIRQSDSVINQFIRFIEPSGPTHVHQITTRDVELYLKSIPGKGAERRASKKTWNNYRGDLHAFFAFCADPRRRWIGTNPATPIHKFKLGSHIPGTFTVWQAARLMRDVETFKEGRLVRYFALALFAGMRPDDDDGEIWKLDQHPDRDRLIDLKRGVINIPPEVSKTGQKRQVLIRPNLRHWLENSKAEIFPTNHSRDIKAIRARHPWARDITRHTFYSMHVAAFRSVGDAAIEGGSAESIVKKHYLNLCTQSEGMAFWRISPQGVRIPKRDANSLLRVA